MDTNSFHFWTYLFILLSTGLNWLMINPPSRESTYHGLSFNMHYSILLSDAYTFPTKLCHTYRCSSNNLHIGRHVWVRVSHQHCILLNLPLMTSFGMAQMLLGMLPSKLEPLKNMTHSTVNKNGFVRDKGSLFIGIFSNFTKGIYHDGHENCSWEIRSFYSNHTCKPIRKWAHFPWTILS